jgi:hypothetical protein
MELEIINPNGDNVVARKLINVSILIFENCKNWVQKQRSYVIFLIRCHDCPKKQNSSYCSPHKSTLNESKLPM